MFETTELNIKHQKTQKLVKTLFFMMVLLLIAPVLIILATLIHKGGPSISLEFLFAKKQVAITVAQVVTFPP